MGLLRSAFKIKIFILVIFSATNFCEELDAPVVDTTYGSLKGSQFQDRDGKNYYAFRSIPYAKPPIGDLRFKPPEPPIKWEGIRDATQEMPLCPQKYETDIFGQEDCLYLNVYTSNINTTNSPMPVMFYIHGGYFICGEGTMEEAGPEYLIPKNVVIVTTHYRLGSLGFISLDHKSSEMSANNGLRDQVAALKWVQGNIRQFGGDPEQVTIFGISAGSSSVHYLLLSHLSKGLFSKAILQSGAATSHWLIGRNNSALPIAKYLNINTENESEMIAGLKKASIPKLLEAQSKIFLETKSNEIPYGPPVVEGPGDDSLLENHPRNIVDSGNFIKAPMIIGYTNLDGIVLDLEKRLLNETFMFDPKQCVPYYFNQTEFDDIIQEEKKFYWDGGIPIISKDNVDLWTDLLFKYDSVENAKKHGDSVPAYLYEFSMDTKLNLFKMTDPVIATYPGAGHGDDTCYIFKTSITPIIEAGSIEDVSIDRMTTLWTNFAKHGNPTPTKDKLLQDQIWLPMNSKNSNYISLGKNLEAKNFNDVRYNFWKSLYEKYDVFGK